jgi:hypothetical protein
MSYVIYNKESTVLFSVRARSAGMWKDSFGSKGAATRAFNAAVRDGKINADEYAIAERAEFHANIEKEITKTFINPHSGEADSVTLKVNTPRCCDPSSELYWTM